MQILEPEMRFFIFQNKSFIYILFVLDEQRALNDHRAQKQEQKLQDLEDELSRHTQDVKLSFRLFLLEHM